MSSICKWLSGPWLAGIVLLASGCASVQNDAPRETAIPLAAARPSVQLVLAEDAAAALDDVAEQATRDSGLFSAVSAAPKPATPADLTIKLALKAQRRPVSDAETVWEMTTTVLFTVYPSTCARDEYELTADVYDRSGRRLKSYDLRDSDTSVLWLFHGPNCGDAPTPDKVRRAAKGLLQTLYRDIDGDRLLALANTGQAARDARPLVYVEANRAADIFERVALTAPPFARFSFDAKDAPRADYRLSIDFKTNSSEQTMVRSFAAMFTLTVVSPCSATEFTLKAKLIDRSGKEIRAYDLSDSFRSQFDGGRGCQAVNEVTRPEDAAEFFGELFAKMQSDRVFSTEPQRGVPVTN
jgi:hypothetical protein